MGAGDIAARVASWAASAVKSAALRAFRVRASGLIVGLGSGENSGSGVDMPAAAVEAKDVGGGVAPSGSGCPQAVRSARPQRIIPNGAADIGWRRCGFIPTA